MGRKWVTADDNDQLQDVVRERLGVDIGTPGDPLYEAVAALIALLGGGGGGGAFWGGITGTLSSQTDLQGALNAKAPLASPAFTGNPTAPTPATSDNDTSIATTAFVQAVVAALVDSSPAALDTLNELAAALGDDPNFAATVTNALALKAPLASPAFTGTPTAPTQTAGNNTTRLATTAFVTAAVAAARGSFVAVNAQTGTTYTPVLADVGKLVTLTNSGAITVTLPQDSSLAVGVSQSIDFNIRGTGMATFVAGTGASLEAWPTAVSAAQFTWVSAVKVAPNTWGLTGGLASA